MRRLPPTGSNGSVSQMRRPYILAFILFAVVFVVGVAVVVVLTDEWFFVPAGVVFLVVVGVGTRLAYRRVTSS